MISAATNATNEVASFRITPPEIEPGPPELANDYTQVWTHPIRDYSHAVASTLTAIGAAHDKRSGPGSSTR
jgi:hypothetical protein